MLRKFCIVNTCGREDCGNHQQDHEHGAYCLAQDVEELKAGCEASMRLSGEVIEDRNRRIAELEALNATLERSNQRLRQKIDRLSS